MPIQETTYVNCSRHKYRKLEPRQLRISSVSPSHYPAFRPRATCASCDGRAVKVIVGVRVGEAPNPGLPESRVRFRGEEAGENVLDRLEHELTLIDSDEEVCDVLVKGRGVVPESRTEMSRSVQNPLLEESQGSGAPKGGARNGGAKIVALFSLSRSPFSLFVSFSLGGLLVEI